MDGGISGQAILSQTASKPIRYVAFRQRHTAQFHHLHISKTCLLRLKKGCKRICGDTDDEITVEQGEFVYLRCGESLTIANIVDEYGDYFSEGLAIEDSVIASFLRLYPSKPCQNSVRKGTLSQGFDAAFSRVIVSLQDNTLPAPVLIYQAQELLLWLQQFGVCHHFQPCDRLSTRLRNLVETALEYPWKAPDVANQLGMSEATLRRNLAKEGTCFTQILRDARLAFALMRVQTTQQGLADIALESGFSSQSRLNEAFKSRFAITPGKLRRSGMKIIE